MKKKKTKTVGSETCLEFWFSILVLTSGCRVKSGAKYSKYSAENTSGELVWALAAVILFLGSRARTETKARPHRCTAARRWCSPPAAETSRMSCGATTQQLSRRKPATSDGLLAGRTHQQRATFLTVYPPPPSTSSGILKLFTNSTHSLKRQRIGGEGGPRISKGPCKRVQ